MNLMKNDHVSICICTFKRNNMLENLINKLSIQETSNLFSYSIIVIDNDNMGYAEKTIDRLRNDLNLDIIYDIEPERSIPKARNRAIRLATGNYIAIIDDDEFPPPSWLITLYNAILTFGVDGALGPVIPYFEQYPPDWIIKGKFCERPIYRTGRLLRWHETRTGNVLIKKDIFNNEILTFNEQYKNSSSDKAFFKEAIKLGYKFVFVKEAPVYEFVPIERLRPSYYIKRSLIIGYNSYFLYIKSEPILIRIYTFIRSILALLLYTTILPIAIFFGKALLFKLITKASYQFSQLIARFGVNIVKNRNFT